MVANLLVQIGMHQAIELPSKIDTGTDYFRSSLKNVNLVGENINPQFRKLSPPYLKKYFLSFGKTRCLRHVVWAALQKTNLSTVFHRF